MAPENIITQLPLIYEQAAISNQGCCPSTCIHLSISLLRFNFSSIVPAINRCVNRCQIILTKKSNCSCQERDEEGPGDGRVPTRCSPSSSRQLDFPFHELDCSYSELNIPLPLARLHSYELDCSFYELGSSSAILDNPSLLCELDSLSSSLELD